MPVPATAHSGLLQRAAGHRLSPKIVEIVNAVQIQYVCTEVPAPDSPGSTGSTSSAPTIILINNCTHQLIFKRRDGLEELAGSMECVVAKAASFQTTVLVKITTALTSPEPRWSAQSYEIQ